MLIKVSIEALLGTVLYPLATLTSDICTLFVYNVLSTCWTTFCADPFLSIQAVRQLSAGKGVGRIASSSGSPRGEEGGRIRSNGCAQGASEARRRRRCIAIVRRSAPRRRRARETTRRQRKHRRGDVRAGQRADGGSAQLGRLVWRRR